MKKWVLVLCASFLPCMAQAWELSSPSSWCFDASVGVEALYWKPYADDFIYGEYFTGAPIDRELLDLEPEYEWGFRLFASLTDRCHRNFLDFEWARIATSNSEDNSLQAGLTLAQFGFAGSFSIGTDLDTLAASQEANYQKFSAKLGHRFCGDDCRFIYGYLGGRWIYINAKRNSVGVDGSTVTLVQLRSWFHGGGVEAGIGGYAKLWCGLGTSFRVGGIGAVGDRNFSHEANSQLIFASLDQVPTRCVGGLEARAELNYTYSCRCFWIRGQVGYEINYYFNPLLFSTGQTNFGSLFASDFGIGGLILGATVGY